ncbi:MAG TPA: CocE/NonD family hydrolase, partial [Capillimicrobium sp.]
MGLHRLASGALAALGASLLLAPAASAEDVVVASFDGTPIEAHWFPQPGLAPGAQAPTVLMGPGWGSPGDERVDRDPIRALHGAGYNVLTWDPRGFGDSGGTVTIDSPQFEGRDAQALLDWVAARPEARLDGPGDPRAGMTGGSYGGGIQLVLAAIDRRVDVIVPTIAWHSLKTSLFKNETPKLGWAGLLYGSTASRPLDPHIPEAFRQASELGTASAETVQWFTDRGPGPLVGDITVPTLLIQGTVDTLFTPQEAIDNLAILRRNDVPAKMLWYCGGHGICLTDPGPEDRPQAATLAWLRRYLDGDASVDTGPGFDWVDQRGKVFTSPSYPPAKAGRIAATGAGRLRLIEEGGAGPVTDGEGADLIGSASKGITPARADNAVEVTAGSVGKRRAHVVGAPRVKLTYRGTAPAGERPTRVFAQLVDETTGHVLGNQITPIQVTLDGQRRTVTRRLEPVAHTLRGGEEVTLQLVATTVAYSKPRLGGSVRFSAARLTLPLV